MSQPIIAEARVAELLEKCAAKAQESGVKFSTHALILIRLAAEAWIYDPPTLKNAPNRDSPEWLSKGTDLFAKILEDDRVRNSPEVSFPQLLRAVSEVSHTAFTQWGYK